MKRAPYLSLLVILFVLMCPEAARALGARIRAMGGAGIAIADDENTVFLNPAGLSQINRTLAQIGAQVVERDQWKSDHAVFASRIYQTREQKRLTLEQYLESDYEFRAQPERISNWSYGVAWMHERRSADLGLKVSGEYVHEDQSQLIFGFATRFPIAERLTRRPELYGGFALRFLNHNWRNPSLGESAQRDMFDLDLSLFYRANSRLNIGGVFESVVSEKSDASPGVRDNSAAINLGAAYTLGEKRDTLVAMDWYNVLGASRDNRSRWKFGVERRFLENDFALRLGTWDGMLTLGFGLKFFDNFKMDYAYQNGNVSKEHYVSVRLPF